jgi:hypothetical protein
VVAIFIGLFTLVEESLDVEVCFQENAEVRHADVFERDNHQPVEKIRPDSFPTVGTVFEQVELFRAIKGLIENSTADILL